MEKENRDRKQLAAYSIAHFCMDALCVYFLYAYCRNPLLWIVLYHGIAFGLQPVIGYLMDRFPQYSYGSLSFVLIALGYFCHDLSTLSLMILGIGNAMFHVEGGYASLHQKVPKLASGGIFVSAGAFGVALSTMFGRYQYEGGTFLMFLIWMIGFARMVSFPLDKNKRREETSFHIVENQWIYGILLCITIVIRGYAGSLLPMEYSGVEKIWIVGIASFAGKFLGGILSDRYGAKKVSSYSQFLVCLLPLCLIFPQLTILMIICMNIPMAVTLAALCDMFPRNTGFAFGLAPLGLFIAYIMMYTVKIDTEKVMYCIIGMMICSGMIFRKCLK